MNSIYKNTIEEHEKRRNDRASTYEMLKEMILDRKLPENVPIPQTKLIEEFSFGRTPLREALLQLSEEGLIRWEQNRRIIIEPLTAEGIDQISSMKILLDSFFVRHSVPLLSEEDFTQLHSYLGRMEELIGKGINENELRKTHYLFHATFRKHCGSIFEKELEKIDTMSERYRREFKQIMQNYDIVFHREMLKAAQERRAEFVGSLLANHYAKTSLKVISEKDPMYEPVFIRQALKVVGMTGGYDGTT